MGSMAWDEQVAWFDIAAASAAFMAHCGPEVTLISMEVREPARRLVQAYYCISGYDIPIYVQSPAVQCDAGVRWGSAGRVGEWLGREAARTVEAWRP